MEVVPAFSTSQNNLMQIIVSAYLNALSFQYISIWNCSMSLFFYPKSSN